MEHNIVNDYIKDNDYYYVKIYENETIAISLDNNTWKILNEELYNKIAEKCIVLYVSKRSIDNYTIKNRIIDRVKRFFRK